MNDAKHGGCADCKTRDTPELYSVVDPAAHLSSKAVCWNCLQRYPEAKR